MWWLNGWLIPFVRSPKFLNWISFDHWGLLDVTCSSPWPGCSALKNLLAYRHHHWQSIPCAQEVMGQQICLSIRRRQTIIIQDDKTNVQALVSSSDLQLLWFPLGAKKCSQQIWKPWSPWKPIISHNQIRKTGDVEDLPHLPRWVWKSVRKPKTTPTQSLPARFCHIKGEVLPVLGKSWTRHYENNFHSTELLLEIGVKTKTTSPEQGRRKVNWLYNFSRS